MLFVSAHHIAVDGWSIYLLIEELRLLYDPPARDGGPLAARELATIAITSPGKPNCSREARCIGPIGKRGLHGDLPLRTADHSRPAVQSYRGVSQAFQLSAALTAQLERVARHYHCTLYVLLLAAYRGVVASLQRTG